MGAPKPAHLGRAYGAQFEDPSVVAAYRHRPPYPAELAGLLARLAGRPHPYVLEIGGGSGDLTEHLVGFARRVDVVEPSVAMRRILESRVVRRHTNVRVIAAPAETAKLDPPYDLAVAGESLHWTEWEVTLPRIAAGLAANAYLVIVNRTERPPAHAPALRNLIARYSTNTDYAPYDLVEELTSRNLFRVQERASLPFVRRPQSIDAVVETMHSRNGFSRERMRPADAEAFDRAYRQLLRAAYPNGIVPVEVGADVVWGTPAPGSAART